MEPGEDPWVVGTRQVKDRVPGDESVKRPARVDGPHVAEDEGRSRYRIAGQVEHPGGPVETGDCEPAAVQVRGNGFPAPAPDVEDMGPRREWGD